jgi:hypothetical protein
MLLKALYKISLERPEHWALWIGLPPGTGDTLGIRIEYLNSFVYGFRHATENLGLSDNEADAFYNWLIDVKDEFPTRGWVSKYLEDCNGDHIAAISKFWSLLYEYLLMTRPEWIVSLNSEQLASQLKNGAGVSRSNDIRNQEHIRVLIEHAV